MKLRSRRVSHLNLALGILVSCLAIAQPASAQSKEEQAPPVSGLVPDHATISVADIEREAEWYTRVLGFKLWRKMGTDPDNINYQMWIPGYRIDIVQYKGSKRPTPVDPLYLQQGWIHVVFHVDDVARALAQLQALHVVPKEVNKDAQGNLIQIRLRDPENNEIEIGRIIPNQPK
jgi:catechol 2,3-dioxygenase-like lactoylglutathione lyase family enzyme